MGIYRAACAVIGFAFGGDEKLRIKSSKVWIGDTCNANQGAGITINQLDLDNEILALKSSDVGHGITCWTETDTYLGLKKNHVTGGGLYFQTYSGSFQGNRSSRSRQSWELRR